MLVPTIEAGADDDGFQAERFQKTCEISVWQNSEPSLRVGHVSAVGLEPQTGEASVPMQALATYAEADGE